MRKTLTNVNVGDIFITGSDTCKGYTVILAYGDGLSRNEKAVHSTLYAVTSYT
jgi:hypothetical protein